MILHRSDCPWWHDTGARCVCPREWRIERDRHPRDSYPWRVLRRCGPDGHYELFVRAATHHKATSLVAALISFDRSFAP